MDLNLPFESQMQPHPLSLEQLKAITETNQPINNQDKAENLSSFVSVSSHEQYSKIEATRLEQVWFFCLLQDFKSLEK